MKFEDGPFAGVEISDLIDLTLPPDHIKALDSISGTATIFRLDAEREIAIPVATWPERAPDG